MKTNKQILSTYPKKVIEKWSPFRHNKFILALINYYVQYAFEINWNGFLSLSSWKTIEELINEKKPENKKVIVYPTVFSQIKGTCVSRFTQVLKLLTIFEKTYEKGKSIEDTGFHKKFLCLTWELNLVTIYIKCCNTLENNEELEEIKIESFQSKKADPKLKLVLRKFHESHNGNKKWAGQEVLNTLVAEIAEFKKMPFERDSAKLLEMCQNFDKIKEDLN